MPVCPSCGIGYMDGEAHICHKSGRRVSGSVAVRDAAGSVEIRYMNAYRVATVIINLGVVVQIAGGALAVLALVVSLAPGSLAIAAFGGLSGIAIGIVFGLFGMFIRAQGELLRATLDTAVNSSPFLTTDQKATAMGVT